MLSVRKDGTGVKGEGESIRDLYWVAEGEGVTTTPCLKEAHHRFYNSFAFVCPSMLSEIAEARSEQKCCIQREGCKVLDP